MSAEGINIRAQVSRGLVARIIEAMFAFVATVLFARILGPSDFGSYYLLIAVTMVITRPVIGVTKAAMKRTSEADSNHDELFGLQLLVSLAFVPLVAGIAILFSDRVTSYFGHPETVSLLTIMVLAVVLFSPCQELLVSIQGRFSTKVWLETARTMLMSILQLALVLLGFGVIGMVLGYVLSALLVLPITIYLLRTWPVLPSRDVVASVWKFARYSTVGAMVNNVYNRLDVLLLGFILSSAAVGHYEVASKLTLPATFISGMASTALMPKLSSLDSLDQSVGKEISEVLSYASLLAIPIFFGSLAVADLLVVTAYGTAYREAAILLPGLALFRLLRSQAQQFQSALDGLNYPNIHLKIAVVAVIFNIISGYLLTVAYGAIGVIIATIAAEIIQYGGSWYVLRRHVDGLTPLPSMLQYQLVAGIPTFAAAKFVMIMSPSASLSTLVAALVAGATGYFGTLFALSHELREQYLYPRLVR